MKERLDAKQVWIVAVELGVPVFVDIGPTAGQAWKILCGYGYHDEGAPLTCLFAMDYGDGAGFRDMATPFALASATYAQIYAQIAAPECLIMRAGMVLRFNCAAKTSGKSAVIVLFVEELTGETVYAP